MLIFQKWWPSWIWYPFLLSRSQFLCREHWYWYPACMYKCWSDLHISSYYTNVSSRWIIYLLEKRRPSLICYHGNVYAANIVSINTMKACVHVCFAYFAENFDHLGIGDHFVLVNLKHFYTENIVLILCMYVCDIVLIRLIHSELLPKWIVKMLILLKMTGILNHIRVWIDIIYQCLQSKVLVKNKYTTRCVLHWYCPQTYTWISFIGQYIQ